MFKCDYKRMTGRQLTYSVRTIATLLFRYQIRYVLYLRAYQQKKNLILRLLMYRLTRKYGLEISPNAQIGEGLYLGHPYNITVSGNVKLGDMINLHKGCTIGEVNSGRLKGSPTIGNRVYIGINSTVVGNITVGDDVMICANTFVNFDVPSHSVVINGVGGVQVHHKENATEHYIERL